MELGGALIKKQAKGAIQGFGALKQLPFLAVSLCGTFVWGLPWYFSSAVAYHIE